MRLISRVMACTLFLGLRHLFGSIHDSCGSGWFIGGYQRRLLKDWQAQKKTMMEIADAMPADKFDYKATPAERNYGEQVLHVAQVNMFLLKTLNGKATTPTFDPKAAKTKEEMIKGLKAWSDSVPIS